MEDNKMREQRFGETMSGFDIPSDYSHYKLHSLLDDAKSKIPEGKAYDTDVSKRVREVIKNMADADADVKDMISEVTQSHAMLRAVSEDPRVRQAVRESALSNFPLSGFRKKYGLFEIIKWFFYDLATWVREKLTPDSAVRRISLKPWYNVTPEERDLLIKWLMKQIDKIPVEWTEEDAKAQDGAREKHRAGKVAGDGQSTSLLEPDLINHTQADYDRFEAMSASKPIDLQKYFDASLQPKSAPFGIKPQQKP